MQIVILDITTGKFTDSFEENLLNPEQWKDYFAKIPTLPNGKPAKKVIKYQCLNDDDFDIYDQMKLR